MDIFFATAELQKECNDFGLLVERYGAVLAPLIRRRLDELYNANNMEEMRALGRSRGQELCREDGPRLRIDIDGTRYLSVEPGDYLPADKDPSDPPSRDEEGKAEEEGRPDFSRIRSVRILGVTA